MSLPVHNNASPGSEFTYCMIVDIECESLWRFRWLCCAVHSQQVTFSVARVHHNHHRSGIWKLWKNSLFSSTLQA